MHVYQLAMVPPSIISRYGGNHDCCPLCISDTDSCLLASKYTTYMPSNSITILHIIVHIVMDAFIDLYIETKTRDS